MSNRPEHPQIDYPCRWEYRLIGRSENDLRAAVRPLVEGMSHDFVTGHESRRGKYCSLSLLVTVSSEEMRLSLFAALREAEEILWVL